jgi:hypothetical protein
MKVLMFSVLFFLSFTCFSQVVKNGDLKNNVAGNLIIWSTVANSWVDIETFWMEYAKQNGGFAWGKSDQYPEYSKVKEQDTLLIETKKGVCLMEFFHQRWRRANDVMRWNDGLNEYAGCPYVFD